MPISPLQLVGYGFTVAVTWSCVQYLRSGELKQDLGVFRGRSKRDWAEIVLGDTLVIGAIVLAYYAAASGPAFLQWSWTSLLASKGDSNQGTNQMLAGASIPYFGPIFLLLLFVNLPRLAMIEEEIFRDGTKNWWHAVPRSLRFGLMHLIVGVPLWVGLALAVPGMWFTAQYFKGGVPRSTMAHALYNMAMATMLFAIVCAQYVSPSKPTNRTPMPPASSHVRGK